MKSVVISICLFSFFHYSIGQNKYLTNNGVITFYSHTVIEDITATNEKVAAVIDIEGGKVAIIVVMNEFQFDKKLMQEHFNENYVESEKYPKATFNGLMAGMEQVDFKTPGKYRVQVNGEMMIHGVTRTISTEASIEVRQNSIIAHTKFLLNPEDYGIRIPRVVRKNIAEKLEITAELICSPV